MRKTKTNLLNWKCPVSNKNTSTSMLLICQQQLNTQIGIDVSKKNDGFFSSSLSKKKFFFWVRFVDVQRHVSVVLPPIFPSMLPFCTTTQKCRRFTMEPNYLWNGILFPKLFWFTVRNFFFSDWGKLLKLKAEGWEFAKILRSLKVSKSRKQLMVSSILQTNERFLRFLRSNKLEQS